MNYAIIDFTQFDESKIEKIKSAGAKGLQTSIKSFKNIAAKGKKFLKSISEYRTEKIVEKANKKLDKEIDNYKTVINQTIKERDTKIANSPIRVNEEALKFFNEKISVLASTMYKLDSSQEAIVCSGKKAIRLVNEMIEGLRNNTNAILEEKFNARVKIGREATIGKDNSYDSEEKDNSVYAIEDKNRLKSLATSNNQIRSNEFGNRSNAVITPPKIVSNNNEGAKDSRIERENNNYNNNQSPIPNNLSYDALVSKYKELTEKAKKSEDRVNTAQALSDKADREVEFAKQKQEAQMNKMQEAIKDLQNVITKNTDDANNLERKYEDQMKKATEMNEYSQTLASLLNNGENTSENEINNRRMSM